MKMISLIRVIAFKYQENCVSHIITNMTQFSTIFILVFICDQRNYDGFYRLLQKQIRAMNNCIDFDNEVVLFVDFQLSFEIHS